MNVDVCVICHNPTSHVSSRAPRRGTTEINKTGHLNEAAHGCTVVVCFHGTRRRSTACVSVCECVCVCVCRLVYRCVVWVSYFLIVWGCVKTLSLYPPPTVPPSSPPNLRDPLHPSNHSLSCLKDLPRLLGPAPSSLPLSCLFLRPSLPPHPSACFTISTSFTK